MTTTLILIVLSAAVLLLALRAARRHHRDFGNSEQLESQTLPVDLPAFRNLVDPAEEVYLRDQLLASEFRVIQRQRMRAAIEYVRRAAENADILLRVGEAARRDVKPEVAATGRELANNALRLQINARLTLGVLYVRVLFPGSHISVDHLIDIYQSAAEGVTRLRQLRNPAYASPTASTL